MPVDRASPGSTSAGKVCIGFGVTSSAGRRLCKHRIREREDQGYPSPACACLTTTSAPERAGPEQKHRRGPSLSVRRLGRPFLHVWESVRRQSVGQDTRQKQDVGTGFPWRQPHPSHLGGDPGQAGAKLLMPEAEEVGKGLEVYGPQWGPGDYSVREETVGRFKAGE